MFKIIISVLLPLVLVFSSFLANAENPIARLKRHPLQESYQKEARVGGRIVTGVVVAGIHFPGQMALIVPESDSGMNVCVQIMSRDGRYWSKNTFELPMDIGSDPIELEYPSQYLEILKDLQSDELAILTREGDCSNGDAGDLLLSGWSGYRNDKREIRIFVNSARSDAYVVVKNNPLKRRPTRCKEIQQGRRTAYDTVCTIKLPELNKATTRLDIKIMRRRYERMLPPVEFTLKMPGVR